MPLYVAETKLWSLPELSDILGVSEVSLRLYLKHGKLIGQKIGGRWFVSETNLKDFIENKQAKTAQAAKREQK